MTQSKFPYIYLKRLLITSKLGKVVYDELFHEGVNIIRGVNSSGKSTISNFIFFVMGGEFYNWTKDAFLCDYVFAEVEINGKVYTLKRQVSDVTGRPLSIFWGDLESSKTSIEGWQTYPYKQTENQVSFSTMLFNLLDFPEVRSNDDNKITINQVLRLLYIDQDSPVQNLFRFERFDQHTTRQAIAELLLGIYDDLLYNERLDLKAANKEIEKKQSELDNVIAAFKAAGNSLTIDELDKQIKVLENRLIDIDKDIVEINAKETVTQRQTTPLKIQSLSSELSTIKQSMNDLILKKDQIQADIDDSVLFIDVLNRRLKAIDESDTIRTMLGDIPLNFCPKCLKPLTKKAEDGNCDLCHQELPDKNGSNISRMRQEISLQVRESTQLLEIKERRLNETSIELQQYSERARAIQRDIDLESRSTRTTRDVRIDSLMQERGSVVSGIAFLNQQHKILDLLKFLTEKIAELTGKASLLNSSILLRSKQQENNRTIAMASISSFTRILLKNDLERQEEFENPKIIDVDFANDVFNLDGSYNFSASSNIYFKNSVRFSLLFASLNVNMMRYPRFILCDNMEDKGMEPERSQKFQKNIVELSQAADTKHQIIFSTSMIAPELDAREDLCVGRKYSKEHKSLTF